MRSMLCVFTLFGYSLSGMSEAKIDKAMAKLRKYEESLKLKEEEIQMIDDVESSTYSKRDRETCLLHRKLVEDRAKTEQLRQAIVAAKAKLAQSKR